MTEIQIAQLEQLFCDRDDVGFAILFGSAVSGRQTMESDVDIAVYFSSSGTPRERGRSFDLEEPDVVFPGEDELWGLAEHICDTSVDLVVLNRAPATVAAAAVLTGRPLAMNDRLTYLRFFAAVTTLAEDFRDFVEDFVQIKKRSQSLSEIDRGRLFRIADFLRTELADAESYSDLNAERYATDNHYRRSVERWVENLVNASIDVAKIVLGAEKLPLPQTYRATMEALVHVKGFKSIAGRLAENTRVRNILAHEYLDLRYTQSAAVAADAESIYATFLDSLDSWMNKQTR